MSYVLQVITSTARRGAEIFGVDLHEALRARGRPVRTVALTASPYPGGLDIPALGPRPRAMATLRALRREAQRSRLVVAHGSDAVAATAIATIGTRSKFVYRNIGDPRFWLSTPLRRAGMRFFLRRASAVVALWPGSRDALRELGTADRKIRIIPTGVPASRFAPVDERRRTAARHHLGIENGAVTVVYIGSLSGEKNVDAAITAVAGIPAMRLLVVGDGPDRSELEALASRAAPGRVQFTGSLEDPGQALAAADVLVLPSRTEGIPAVLIEAAFSEVPIVATAVGGVGEIVVDGETGRLVPPGNPAALGSALTSTISAGSAFGRAARERCLARFEMNVIAEAWDRLLHDLGAWETKR